MNMKPFNEAKLDRRQTLTLLGSLGVVVATGCESESNGSNSNAGGSGGAGGTGSTGTWATGGTASMSGSYPDPFTDTPGSSCTLTCSQILGPCYASTLVRKDISAGENGLSMRIALLVVDESCKPIEGASVDIWHAAPRGVYSSFEPKSQCNPGEEELTSESFFRGVQSTDAKGRVDFDSCFPGWYPGRAIHVHLTIRIDDVEYVTSQLYFPDALTDEIVATQPLYSDRGARDTTNKNDIVIDADAAGDFIFETAKMPDGALQAWKVVVIRSSLDSALCTAPGSLNGGGGAGGIGGGPPGS